MLQDVLALLFIVAKECRHIRNDGGLAEIVLDHLGDIGVQGLVIGNAAARRIGQCNLALSPGAQQSADPQHRIGKKNIRIEKQVVDSAVNHIDACQSVNGAHVDTVVIADNEIGSLDQLHAHFPGEKNVLKIGRVEDAWRQHDNLGLLHLSRTQARQHLKQIFGVVVDGPDLFIGEQLRQHAFGDGAILDHIRHTGRHPKIVFEYVKRSVTVADQV